MLEEGDRYYLDESFALSNISAVLDGGRWIMPANADEDKIDTSDNGLSFTADRGVNVYVAYDAAATVPCWMSGFITTGSTISTTDPAPPILRR